MKREGTMSELLRESVAAEPSLNALAKATGLARASLRLFRDGKQALRLDLADRLAQHYGIAAVRKTRKGK